MHPPASRPRPAHRPRPARLEVAVALWGDLPRVAAEELGHSSEDAGLDEGSPVPLVVFVQVGKTLDRNSIEHNVAGWQVDVPTIHAADAGGPRRCRGDADADACEFGRPECAHVVRRLEHGQFEEVEPGAQRRKLRPGDRGSQSPPVAISPPAAAHWGDSGDSAGHAESVRRVNGIGRARRATVTT